jgi:hypothetical protein
MKVGKSVIKTVGVLFSIVLILSIVFSCQELLNEALKQEVSLNQTIFQDVTATAPAGETIPVVNNQTILNSGLFSGIGYIAKTLSDTSFEVSPSNPVLFTKLMLEEKINLIGHGNTNGSTGDFGIYFSASGGLSDPKSTATKIVEFNLSGLTEIDIDVSSEMKPFFVANPDIGTFYIYLVHSNGTATITIDELKFVLPSVVIIEQIIEQDTTVVFDDIEEIINVNIAGSATNNGAGTVYLIVEVVEASDPAHDKSWEGAVATASIIPGASIAFDDISIEREKIEGALEYLSDLENGGNLKATVVLVSTNPIEVDIDSIDILGTAVIGL